MVKRWVKVAEPELRLRVESWTQGSDISAVQRDGGLGDLAPVVVLNIGNRGIGLYLPFAGPQPGILLDAVFGARFDPTGNPEAVVEGGRLKVWLLRYPRPPRVARRIATGGVSACPSAGRRWIARATSSPSTTRPKAAKPCP